MNAKILQIASASKIELLKSIRCGFELELQRVDGLRYEGECTCDECSGDFHEHVSENLSEVPGHLWRWEPDGSVGAGEITTVGGLTVADFLKAAKPILKQAELGTFEIDTECSFHIHLSVPGIRHSYSEKFQKNLIEGIMKNSAKLPARVLKRWQNTDWLSRYFDLHLSDDKYSFVNFHEEYGTWEFRCFGNVASFEDAVSCLMVAAEALQYAYRVKTKMENPEFKYTRTMRFWSRELKDLFRSSASFKEFHKEYKRKLYERNQTLKSSVTKRKQQERLKKQQSA